MLFQRKVVWSERGLAAAIAMKIWDQHLQVTAQLLCESAERAGASSRCVEGKQRAVAVANCQAVQTGLFYFDCQPSRTRFMIFLSSEN